ncbi:PREDICTED: uncharacterized protein LOC109589900 [Amphimedon queenslandica]|uniref:SRCR domain-containing protein n=1 Tax=Amphimedon queenslandica TaxID=400682 RepID=A0AAN0JX10_AMPQE|nr:PREDICTED: uncharacterized protein LOC109589900 [Amphimedon queenslandica]|eukprot:XP_019861444.1 PREDICTED: uncharacterized protein LOC109589900 [Amphimedon queenslandica]
MTSPVWVDDITCTESESCFSTNCVNDDQSEVTSGPCAGHAMDISLSCTFVSTDGDTLLSGNEFICRIHGADVLVIVLSSVFGFFFLTCLCALITCIVCCYTVRTCPLYAYKQKRKYQGLI